MNEYGPFYKLMNFSDCEGVIGQETAEKLYRDFIRYKKAYREYVEKFSDDPEWFKYIYDKWTEALLYADVDQGAIVFC